MISDMPFRTKTLFIGLLIAIFASSVAFGLVFATDVEESKAMTYATVFIIIFVSLNLILLAVGYSAYRKAKARMRTVECASCGTPIDRNAKACPVCRAVQPLLDEDTYLVKKEEAKKDKVRPKK